MTPHGTTIMTISHTNVDSLSQLQPEASDLQFRIIHTLDALEGFKLFKYEAKRIPETIACCPPLIASLNEELVPRLPGRHSLPCVRAGKNGPLGFIEDSKIPATFYIQDGRFLAVIAPGSQAINRQSS